jgi:hypothetical protein
MTLAIRLMPNFTGCREAETPGIQRRLGVVFFVDAHLLKNRPGLFVLGRQLLQVLVQCLHT